MLGVTYFTRNDLIFSWKRSNFILNAFIYFTYANPHDCTVLEPSLTRTTASTSAVLTDGEYVLELLLARLVQIVEALPILLLLVVQWLMLEDDVVLVLVVDVDEGALDIGQPFQLPLERLAHVVRDLQRRILIHDNVHLDVVFLAGMVGPTLCSS